MVENNKPIPKSNRGDYKPPPAPINPIKSRMVSRFNSSLIIAQILK